MALYDEIKAAGIKIDNHESDLYFPVTMESTRILDKHPSIKEITRTFRSTFDHSLWYDVPFAYIPWWEDKCPAVAVVGF